MPSRQLNRAVLRSGKGFTMKRRSKLSIHAILIVVLLIAGSVLVHVTITPRLIGKHGSYLCNVSTHTFSNTTKAGDVVDVLQVYGRGRAATDVVLNHAIQAVGSINNVTFLLGPGKWSVAANVTFTPNIAVLPVAGCILQPASGAVVTISSISPQIGMYKWINLSFGGIVTFQTKQEGYPQWYGFSAINTAEANTVALQNALEYLDLYIPEGTYIVNQIRGVSGRSIRGAGKDKTILKIAKNDTNLFRLTGISVFNVIDLTLDGGSATLTTGGSPGNEAQLHLNQNCSDITVKRVKFTNMLGCAVYSKGGIGKTNSNILIIECDFIDGAYDACQFSGKQSNIKILDSNFYNAVSLYNGAQDNGKAISFCGVNNGIVSDSTFIQTNGYGGAAIIFEWDGVTKSKNCVAKDNYIEGQLWNNLKMDDVDNCSFYHNVCKHAGYAGIYVAGVSNGEIAYNEIHHADKNAIYTTSGGDTHNRCTHLRIIGNSIDEPNYGNNKGSYKWAVRILKSDHIIYKYNIIHDNSKNAYGIYLKSVTDYQIKDNQFYLLHDIVKNGTYRWLLSSSGTGEYYCTKEDGSDPGFDDYGSAKNLGNVYINQLLARKGTAGSLIAGTWDYTDNDFLGFATIYVRLNDDADPDSKPTGYVKSGATGLSKDIEGTNDHEFIKDNIGLTIVDSAQDDMPFIQPSILPFETLQAYAYQ